MAKNMLRRAKKLRAMKFKLDASEFKFRALEFFTTTHLVKTKCVAIFSTSIYAAVQTNFCDTITPQ